MNRNGQFDNNMEKPFYIDESENLTDAISGDLQCIIWSRKIDVKQPTKQKQQTVKRENETCQMLLKWDAGGGC